MALSHKLRSGGPCDNKLDSLGKSVEAIETAGKAVLRLSEIANKCQMAKELHELYDTDLRLTKSSIDQGRPDGRVVQKKKWCAAVDELHTVAVQEVEQSLDSLPLPRSVARQVNRNFDESVKRDGLKLALLETTHKWITLKDKQGMLLSSREVTKAMSQRMREWFKQQGCETDGEPPQEFVNSLREASQYERKREELVKVLANELTNHLVKTAQIMQKELARFARYRDEVIRDAESASMNAALPDEDGQVASLPANIVAAELQLQDAVCPVTAKHSKSGRSDAAQCAALEAARENIAEVEEQRRRLGKKKQDEKASVAEDRSEAKIEKQKQKVQMAGKLASGGAGAAEDDEEKRQLREQLAAQQLLTEQLQQALKQLQQQQGAQLNRTPQEAAASGHPTPPPTAASASPPTEVTPHAATSADEKACASEASGRAISEIASPSRVSSSRKRRQGA